MDMVIGGTRVVQMGLIGGEFGLMLQDGGSLGFRRGDEETKFKSRLTATFTHKKDGAETSPIHIFDVLKSMSFSVCKGFSYSW